MAIGYACLTVDVPNSKLSSCILKNANEENLRKIIKGNITALNTIMEYNKSNHIKLFRISSDIIPFGSHPVNQLKWWEDYKEELNTLGNFIREAGIRVSMHPGQYTVLNSPDANVVEKAFKDLEYHERFLSALGMDEKSKMVLHIGGIYHDKPKAMENFMKNYRLLPFEVKSRLVIENDDKNYNIEDILQISQALGIPAIFDNLHNAVNPPKEVLTDAQWISLSAKTWSLQDGNQKVHYSQQKEGGKPGSHSETIQVEAFLSYYCELVNKNIDIMLEVKDKNISAVKCIQEVEHSEII